MIFFFARVLHQYIASVMPSFSLRYAFALCSFSGLELERTYNGPITVLERTYCYGINRQQVNFFLELNDKHIHGAKCT